MTAEVAVLNKSAVALAADSAVTTGTMENRKIFNTVNKLFTLSKHHPVGIMLNNNAEYMGVPWETIIKLYRKSLGDRSFVTLEDYVHDFFRFVLLNTKISTQEEIDKNISRLIYSLLRQFYKEVRNKINESINRNVRISVTLQRKILYAELNTAMNFFNSLDDADLDPPINFRQFWSKHNAVFDILVDKIFNNIKISKVFRSKLRKFIEIALQKDAYSDYNTEIVIAGFGDDDLFPRLISIRTDGIIEKSLKHKCVVYCTIGSDNTAAVYAFAQHEMVRRFMDGIDPDFENYFRIVFRHVLTNFGVDFTNKHIRSKKRKKKIISSVKTEVNNTINQLFNTDSEKFKKDFFSQKIIDAVEFLPIDELGNLAEALVNLTSLKRRVSSNEQETVGGPVDVAVISKNDGFIWLNRKHYFNKELNPYFMSNYFRK